ncbi:hypothetical protein H2248_003633 [Termitomyces sp. 'cryptogamus']|nr:hypothetical protein H2248_003633 [Termitomyces sp. 'cryptogamus']
MVARILFSMTKTKKCLRTFFQYIDFIVHALPNSVQVFKMGLLWSLDLPAIILFIVDTVHAIRFLTSAQRGDEVLVVWSSMDTDQNEFDLWFGDCDHGEQFRSRVRSNVDAFNSGEGGLVVFYLPREVSSFDLLVTCRIIAVAVGCDPSSSPALDSLLLSIEPPVSSASSRTTFTIGHFSISSSPANPVARTSLLQPTSTTTVVITFNTIPVQTSVSISGSTQSILSNLSPLRPTSSTRMQSNDIPGGAIAGGVIGALVALGALIIFLVFLRRRRRFTSSLIPVPLPYDVNYVQPLEKRNQITRKKKQ